MIQEHTDLQMGYKYNGKLKSAEILLKEDGTTEMIRRAEKHQIILQRSWI